MSRLLVCCLLLSGCAAGRGNGVSEAGRPPEASEQPLELLSKRIDGWIDEGRYFKATELTRKLLDLFPDYSGGLSLQDRIEKGVAAELKAGPRAAYAQGYRAYFAKHWAEAVSSLSEAAAKEPGNDEVRDYLNEASRRRDELQELEKLKAGARISFLYDLANTAYSSGDGGKALKILDEILKISSYSPATRLEMEILDEQGGASESAKASEGKGPKKARDLYYRAVRKYGEGDLAGAVELLRDAQVLDPESLDIRSTLERAEQEWNASKTAP